MSEALLVLGILLSSYLGFLLVALSQERHWHAAGPAGFSSSRPSPWGFAVGIVWLCIALGLAIASQGPSFGALLWVMTLSGAAMGVAFTLAWRPQALRPLVRLLLQRARARRHQTR